MFLFHNRMRRGFKHSCIRLTCVQKIRGSLQSYRAKPRPTKLYKTEINYKINFILYCPTVNCKIKSNIHVKWHFLKHDKIEVPRDDIIANIN